MIKINRMIEVYNGNSYNELLFIGKCLGLYNDADNDPCFLVEKENGEIKEIYTGVCKFLKDGD